VAFSMYMPVPMYPALLTVRALKVATPLIAFAVVPESVALPGFERKEIVMLLEAVEIVALSV